MSDLILLTRPIRRRIARDLGIMVPAGYLLNPDERTIHAPSVDHANLMGGIRIPRRLVEAAVAECAGGDRR